MTNEPDPSQIYLPAITKARWIKRFQLGEYLAVLGTDCESVGLIFYTHILYLFRENQPQPLLAVSSEYTDITGQDGSRCLGLFADRKHYNLGFSVDWADLQKFGEKALEVAAKHLKIPEQPRELPLPPKT